MTDWKIYLLSVLRVTMVGKVIDNEWHWLTLSSHWVLHIRKNIAAISRCNFASNVFYGYWCPYRWCQILKVNVFWLQLLLRLKHKVLIKVFRNCRKVAIFYVFFLYFWYCVVLMRSSFVQYCLEYKCSFAMWFPQVEFITFDISKLNSESNYNAASKISEIF